MAARRQTEPKADPAPKPPAHKPRSAPRAALKLAPSPPALLTIEYLPLDSLRAYERNARTHSPAQVAQIAASIKAFGFTNPVLIDDAGEIIAGHGRLLAARKLSMAQVPAIRLPGLTPAQRRALRIADNKLALNAGWDETLLADELGALRLEQFDLSLIGFDGDELAALLDGEGDGSSEPGAGTLLELVNITIADPSITLAPGDHYVLAERHHLLCASVIEDHALWAPLLTADALFCPYPGPFVPFGTKADSHRLVMVQPDPYIAGHLLDRYTEIHGRDAIAKARA